MYFYDITCNIIAIALFTDDTIGSHKQLKSPFKIIVKGKLNRVENFTLRKPNRPYKPLPIAFKSKEEVMYSGIYFDLGLIFYYHAIT